MKKAYKTLDETKINKFYNNDEFSTAISQLIYETLVKCNNVEGRINVNIKPEANYTFNRINIEIKQMPKNSSTKDKRDSIVIPVLTTIQRLSGIISIQGYECVSSQDYKTKVIIPWKDGECLITVYYVRIRL
jgi:hypothetical protein